MSIQNRQILAAYSISDSQGVRSMDDFITLLILAGALGTDATSVAMAIGMNGIERGQISITSITVGLFHVIMPLIGLYLGKIFGTFLGNVASIIGAVIIIILGINMLRESFNNKSISYINLNGWQMVLLALSVSLDSFSVGFSLGTFFSMRKTTIVLTIGIVAALMTAAGMIAGKNLGKVMGDKAEAVGGIILMFIGLKILFGVI